MQQVNNPITDFMQPQYRFLSNFYPSVIGWNNKLYDTVEHAYQAAKTLDEYEHERIRNMPTPGKAKYLGRLATIRSDWDEIKIPIMKELVTLKFRQNEVLYQKLIETYPMELIEGNVWGDTFWGVCNN